MTNVAIAEKVKPFSSSEYINTPTIIKSTPDNREIYWSKNLDDQNWDWKNLTPWQEKYCRYNEVEHVSDSTNMKKRKAPACISAISETNKYVNDLRNRFSGYELSIYPLYTELTSKDNRK